ncbi:helix-turn-helix domain-containing protein [Spirillospora sp. NPDC047279]|uniref:TetR/AcrR family transcriptional regulator n=1 Tax=Spirillospora sp. NPDC047279 TaxID=3155478 RepID=UPI0033CC54F7
MTEKPLRADARRNRTRILEAAEAVFAEKGPAASTEEVAERAGVAIGTVFRHFPTKDELFAAIMKDLLRRLTDEAERLVADDDPAALFTFFTSVVTQAAATRTVAGLLQVSPAEPIQGFTHVLETLLARAQAGRTVRPDVHVSEVVALLTAACQGALLGAWSDDLRDRTLAIIFKGMR